MWFALKNSFSYFSLPSPFVITPHFFTHACMRKPEAVVPFLLKLPLNGFFASTNLMCVRLVKECGLNIDFKRLHLELTRANTKKMGMGDDDGF